MNYDLDTPDGLDNAIQWTDAVLSNLKPGGQWIVPRSNTVVTVRNHQHRVCRVFSAVPDPSIVRVLKAAGWTVMTLAEDIEEVRQKLAEEYASGFDSASGLVGDPTPH